MSIWHWLITIVAFVLVAWPASQILKRMGYSPWWGLLAPVAPFNIVGLWLLAYKDWPIKAR